MRFSSKIFKYLFYSSLLALLIGISSCKQSEEANLSDYIQDNAQKPVNYIIEKFEEKDFVFLGEFHRFKHDLQLVNDLIPELYSNGIYNLAIEFGNYEDQSKVDSLLALPTFNRHAFKEIMWNYVPLWGYKEYIDLYHSAWKVNQSGSRHKFRIVLLHPKYDPCKPGGPWSDVDPDEFMANVFIEEIASKGKQALIFAGAHHSFTKYHQPLHDFKNDSLIGYTDNRLGNIVYDKYPYKTFNIFLHSPWVSDEGWHKRILPVAGSLDSIMQKLEIDYAGFDVIGSPLPNLSSDDTYYAFGYEDFSLGDFCDGYIYNSDISQYEFVQLEEGFLNEQNLNEFEKFLQCLGMINSIDSVNNLENAYKILEEHSLSKQKRSFHGYYFL